MIAALLLATQVALYFNDVTAFNDGSPCKVRFTDMHWTSEPPYNLAVKWDVDPSLQCNYEKFSILLFDNIATISLGNTYENKIFIAHLQPCTNYKIGVSISYGPAVWSKFTRIDPATISFPEVTAVTPESLRVTWYARDNQCLDSSVVYLTKTANHELVSKIHLNASDLTEVEFTGLEQCTRYTVETSLVSNGTTFKRRTVSVFTTSDSAVYNVTTFPLNATSIHVSWEKIANNCYDNDFQTMLKIDTLQKVVFVGNYTHLQGAVNVTNLTPCTSYRVSLFTVFKGGNISAATWNTIVHTTPDNKEGLQQTDLDKIFQMCQEQQRAISTNNSTETYVSLDTYI